MIDEPLMGGSGGETLSGGCGVYRYRGVGNFWPEALAGSLAAGSPAARRLARRASCVGSLRSAQTLAQAIISFTNAFQTDIFL
jgi:hypothetical protein